MSNGEYTWKGVLHVKAAVLKYFHGRWCTVKIILTGCYALYTSNKINGYTWSNDPFPLGTIHLFIDYFRGCLEYEMWMDYDPLSLRF